MGKTRRIVFMSIIYNLLETYSWERLFQVESEYTPVEEIKYPMKSFQVKPDGIRRYLEVYKNINKDNYEIFDVLMKKKLVNKD